MELQHKNFALEVKSEGDRTFEGYAAVFNNVDSVNDIILPGAFSASLASGRKVRLCWQHESDEVVGVPDDLREDGVGLYIKGRIATTSCGNDAYELLKMGAIDQMSIGYMVDEHEYRPDGVRLLKKLTLFEVSFVTFPANERAKITNVKTAPENERDFEKFLREEGLFSRAAAKIITARGFKALSGQRDVEADERNEVDAIKRQLTHNINILK